MKVAAEERKRKRSKKDDILSLKYTNVTSARHVYEALTRFICVTRANTCGNACPPNANAC